MEYIVRTGALSSLSLCLPHTPSVYTENFRQKPQKTKSSVDVAGNYADSGYRGKSADWTVTPLVQLKTRRFYICGLSAGVRLCASADQSQEVLLGATYLRDYGLKSSDSDDAYLKRLDRRKNAVTTNTSYNLHSPYGNLETQVSHNVSGTSKGMQTQAQYSYFWQPTPRLLVRPAVGVSYPDKKFNRYYCGVNADEARRSDLNTCRPKSSVHPYIGLETQHSFTPRFNAFAGVLAGALPSTVKNSPMNNGKYRVESVAGLMYRF